MNYRNFVTIKDLDKSQIEKLLELADEIKQNPSEFSDKLLGKYIILLFQKPSLRTRLSFEVGAKQLGANCIYLAPEDVKLGEREEVKDIVRVISKYADCIIVRTFSHQDLLELIEYSTIPIINALTDLLHPCQALSDFYTMKKRKDVHNLKLCYIGDCNNVLHSLLNLSAKLGLNFFIATPEGYEPDKEILLQAYSQAKSTNCKIYLTNNPEEAIKDADIVYTDVWASMGQEAEKGKRSRDFRNFQINSKILRLAKRDYIFMHCLPAHRGEEVTEEVLESPQSIVFEQAQNRLFVQKAILLWVMGEM